MALDQFKPEIFAKKIEQALEKKMVFADFCNREYEGDLKSVGDSVRILELARPTVTTTTDGAPISISAFEELQSAAQTMQILQQSYFAPVLHDVDERQSVDGILEKIMTGGAYALADTMDTHIATVAATGIKDNSSATNVAASGAILPVVDAALAKLYANNVPFNDEIELVCTPRFYMYLKAALISADTDNSELIAKGIAARYGNVMIRVSNNIVTANNGAEDLCIMRTRRAIAFVEQINKLETGRKELGFGTYVKGLALYQAQLVQPKELIVINAKYA